MEELEDLIAEDNNEVDFEIAACELFGAIIEAIISAKRAIISAITSND